MKKLILNVESLRHHFISTVMKSYVDRFDLMLSTALNLGIPRKALALDVGCGSGHFSELLLNNGFYIIGLDLDKQRIGATWDRLKSKQGFQLVRADAQHLPFRTESFDLVVCAEVMEHLPSPALLLKDVATTLKARGKFLLSTPNAAGLWNLLFDRLAGRIHNFISRLSGKSQRYHSGHVSLFTYASLVKTLQRFNFIIERDLERWCVEGLLISLCLIETFRRNFDLDLRTRVIFNILRNIEMKVSGLFPKKLQSAWILLCAKTI